MSFLETRQVGKNFGKFCAVKDVSLTFQKGELTAIIGPNGAGKSTFFNLISGAFPASFGQIFFEGQEITKLKPHEFSHIGIAKSFQITTIFSSLTVLENVRVAAQAHETRYQLFKPRENYTKSIEKAQYCLSLVGLIDMAHKNAKELAHGQQRALEIAMALAASPKLLLMDEPTAGMSPQETVTMMELIKELAQQRTIILVEHKMKMVMGLCERLIVLHQGQLLAQGSPTDIQNNEEVKRVYLGGGHA